MLPWVIGTPCFGLLMMWSLGLKARLNLLGCMLHSLCVVCPPAPSPCSVWYFKNITRMVVFGLVFSKNHLESSSWTSIFKESPGELYFCKEIWSISVLFVNFRWCQPWVLKPDWIPRLACFITCAYFAPSGAIPADLLAAFRPSPFIRLLSQAFI